MLPDGWKLTTLGKVCAGDLQTGPFGSQLHAYEYQEEGVPVLMPKDIINYRADISTAAKISRQRADDLHKHRLFTGDLLFSRRGDVSRFALIDERTEGSLCGTGCLKARPSRNHSPIFLSYILQNNTVKTWLEQNAVGQTMPNMNTAILNELPLISASSREEEDRIAQILSTWDKAIEKLHTLIIAKQKRKKALMQQLLTGKKRFAGFEGKWKAHHLGELFTERNETGYVDLNLLSITREKGVIPREEVERKDTSNDNKSKYLRIYPGDIGYNTMRMWQGVSALSTFEGIVSPAYTICTPKENIDGKFAAYLFKTTFIIHLFQRYSQGLTSDTWNLKFHHFSEIKVCIPKEIKEQQKIASVLSAADKEIETHQKQLSALKQQKKGLMQQLLTGKKRVKIDEPVPQAAVGA